MYMPTGAISMPMMKGTRQPQLCFDSVDSVKVSRPSHDRAEHHARPWLANCQLAM